ncbi:MAG: hypothetical protein ACD_38C00046G0002 [uncultured bacterium]|nr:MAG: hypothetical protein ACD_38C00046G0002 [uncultured bacterium]HLC87900.1 hypothetical protein [Patescibacteria group bacterium]
MLKFRQLPVEKLLTNLVMLYFSIGLIFAIVFALYYRWEWFGYFSPGFFAVLLTWPFQTIGFAGDLLYYGLAGKPTPL